MELQGLQDYQTPENCCKRIPDFIPPRPNSPDLNPVDYKI